LCVSLPLLLFRSLPILQLARVGTLGIWVLSRVPPEQWDRTRVDSVCSRNIRKVAGGCDVMEALRLLTGEESQQMLLVTSSTGKLQGIVTKTDILNALQPAPHRRKPAQPKS
jgi:chloride channel protein, CIC family